MPIRSPDVVYEHRLTFGKKEWQALQPTILAANLTMLGTAAGIVAVGGGVGVAGYAAWKWLQNNAGAIKWLAEHDEWLSVGKFLINPIWGGADLSKGLGVSIGEWLAGK